MTPFLIFAIILTIAYILYYVTIILMDLNAQNKEKGSDQLVITTRDEGSDEELIPQSVVENTNGGFDFVNHHKEKTTNIQEDSQEAIGEAKEETIERSVEESTRIDEINFQQKQQQKKENSETTDYVKKESDEVQNENSNEDCSEEKSEDLLDNISTESIDPTAKEKAPVTKDSNPENKYNPEYNAKKHKVTAVIAPSTPNDVANHIDMVNSSLNSIALHCPKMMTAEMMNKEIEKPKEECSINKQDVYDKF